MSCNIELYKNKGIGKQKLPDALMLLLSRLDIFHENIPNCNDVADTTS